MDKRNGFHILNAASQLLGVSIMVLTLFYTLQVSRESFAEEIVTIATLLFTVSTASSYISLRNKKRGNTYELIADWLFLAGIGCLSITVLILTFILY
jgi:hypothetical protein